LEKGRTPNSARTFSIKAGNLIFVVEIKHDDELREPSEENKKYAEKDTGRKPSIHIPEKISE